ncbi:hypothetical protein GCM10009602_23260 [Nocardiopsis tropica]
MLSVSASGSCRRQGVRAVRPGHPSRAGGRRAPGPVILLSLTLVQGPGAPLGSGAAPAAARLPRPAQRAAERVQAHFWSRIPYVQ